MSRYILQHSDLLEGAELYCIYSDGECHTVGETYAVVKVYTRANQHWHPCGHPYRITDDEDSELWALNELNKTSRVQLYPVAMLTAKERFLFELSGRLPE